MKFAPNPWAMDQWLKNFAKEQGLRFSLLDLKTQKTIHTVSDHVLDYGTLPEALKLTSQYLKPTDGDVILVNDPASGANHGYEITLVTPLKLGTHDVLLGYRFEPGGFRLRPGHRIPPLPVMQKHEMVAALVQHLPGHWNLREHLNVLEKLSVALNKAFAHFDLKTWLDTISKKLHRSVEEWSLKDAQASCELSTGDKICLNLDSRDGRLQFDFSGTSSSEHGGFLESMTLGLCLGAMERVLGWKVPSQSWIEFIELHTRPNTLVSQRTPSDVSMAWSYPLAAEVFAFICETLAQWSHKEPSNKSGSAVLLEWFTGHDHQSDFIDGSLSMRGSGTWPVPSTLPFSVSDLDPESHKPFAREASTVLSKDDNYAGAIRTYDIVQNCSLSCWFSQAPSSQLKIVSGAKEEIIEPKAWLNLELTEGQKLIVHTAAKKSN